MPMAAPEVLDREFFEIRAKILEVAASFDRLERGDGNVANDPRIARLHEAIAVLSGDQHDRAEQVQLIFSREYEDNWQDAFDLRQPR